VNLLERTRTAGTAPHLKVGPPATSWPDPQAERGGRLHLSSWPVRRAGLPAADLALDAALLDLIVEIVPPGVNLNPADTS
jgi:hypothetical protein